MKLPTDPNTTGHWRVFRFGLGWMAQSPNYTTGSFHQTFQAAIDEATNQADLDASRAWRRAQDAVTARHRLEAERWRRSSEAIAFEGAWVDGWSDL